MIYTIKSAGTFKLGLYSNIEKSVCIHNLTKLYTSKTHWLQNQNTHTQKEKIKRKLSDKYTYQYTQKISQGTQNHKKNFKKNKIKKRKNNDNINTLKCHILDKVLKNENKIKKYNSVYNVL
jgi:hypothetical protein